MNMRVLMAIACFVQILVIHSQRNDIKYLEAKLDSLNKINADTYKIYEDKISYLEDQQTKVWNDEVRFSIRLYRTTRLLERLMSCPKKKFGDLYQLKDFERCIGKLNVKQIILDNNVGNF